VGVGVVGDVVDVGADVGVDVGGELLDGAGLAGAEAPPLKVAWAPGAKLRAEAHASTASSGNDHGRMRGGVRSRM
jgi:hypothetical protein